jgi:DNA-binding ferritin-like protein (Dps family)
MKTIKLYESFKEYRAELDRLYKEYEEKKKEVRKNIENDLKGSMHDLTDNYDIDNFNIVESSVQIEVYSTFKIPLTKFDSFKEDLKHSMDIIIEKYEPTDIKLFEIDILNDRMVTSLDIVSSKHDYIYGSDRRDLVSIQERIKRWSDYYNQMFQYISGDMSDEELTKIIGRIPNRIIDIKDDFSIDDTLSITVRIKI